MKKKMGWGERHLRASLALGTSNFSPQVSRKSEKQRLVAQKSTSAYFSSPTLAKTAHTAASIRFARHVSHELKEGSAELAATIELHPLEDTERALTQITRRGCFGECVHVDSARLLFAHRIAADDGEQDEGGEEAAPCFFSPPSTTRPGGLFPRLVLLALLPPLLLLLLFLFLLCFFGGRASDADAGAFFLGCLLPSGHFFLFERKMTKFVCVRLGGDRIGRCMLITMHEDIDQLVSRSTTVNLQK